MDFISALQGILGGNGDEEAEANPSMDSNSGGGGLGSIFGASAGGGVSISDARQKDIQRIITERMRAKK